MRAAVVDSSGPPEAFRLVEIPLPEIGESDVLIRQKYAAVNFGDVTRRKRGLFPQGLLPPYVLGFEGVGVVVAVGSAVHTLKSGDRVAYLAERGGYAEFVAAPITKVWAVPDAVNDETAAGATCVVLTAWGLARQSEIQAGATALIHGAAGGVGSTLVQHLMSLGVETIAVVSGQKKVEFVTGLGATSVIDRTQDDLVNEIKAICPKGVDVVFDCVGQDVLDVNMSVIRPGGVWMYYGSTSGHSQFPGDRVLMERLTIRGFVVFDYFENSTLWAEGTSFLASSLASDGIAVRVTEVFPLDEVSEAHRKLEARSAMGKILLAL